MSLRDQMNAMLGIFGTNGVGSARTTCPGVTPVIHLVDDGGTPAIASATVKSALEVSNRVTTVDLPPGFLTASLDRDNFKIEVVDSNLAPTVTSIPASRITLETLRHDKTPFRPKRVMHFELQRVNNSDVFRSKYIRLVVDDQDKNSCKHQTQYADWDPRNPYEEILAQVVRATYSSEGCGMVSWEATIGNATPMHIRVAVHVLRKRVGGAGIVTQRAAKRRILCWMKRHYAQMSMAPLLIQIREVDPVENLISISNDTGANAFGGGAISFTISSGRGASAKVQHVGPHVPLAGDTPMVTANHLASLIAADVKFQARTVQNNYFMTPAPLPPPGTPPPPPGTPAMVQGGAADLIITDPAGGRVRITALTSTDPAQTADVARVNPKAFLGFTNYTHWWSGSMAQRCILQTYDTGDDRIDIVVVRRIDGPGVPGANFGEAMIFGSYLPAGARGTPKVLNSVYIDRACMNGSDKHPDVISHECGHVLLDAIHAIPTTEIMYSRNVSINHPVHASKRFDENSVQFDDPPNMLVQETRIRLLAAGMMQAFVVPP